MLFSIYSYTGLSKTISEQAEKQAEGRIDKEIKNIQKPTNFLVLELQKIERPQPLRPNTVQPVFPKPQLYELQDIEIDGTRFTQKQWRQLQENRSLKIVIRVKDAAVLREYWYDKADHLQETLVALIRSEKPFMRHFVTDLKGYRLTAQEQKKLYSEHGLIKAFRKQDGTVYRFRFGVRSNPGQKDVPTECVLSQQARVEVKPDTKQQAGQQHKERSQVITIPPKKIG